MHGAQSGMHGSEGLQFPKFLTPSNPGSRGNCRRACVRTLRRSHTARDHIAPLTRVKPPAARGTVSIQAAMRMTVIWIRTYTAHTAQSLSVPCFSNEMVYARAPGFTPVKVALPRLQAH